MKFYDLDLKNEELKEIARLRGFDFSFRAKIVKIGNQDDLKLLGAKEKADGKDDQAVIAPPVCLETPPAPGGEFLWGWIHG